MSRKITKHPVEGGTCKWNHPVLFHHEFDDLLPTLPGKALLGDEAFGVTDDAIGISLCRTISRHEGTEAGRCRSACRHGSRFFRILTGSHTDRNDENGKCGGNHTPPRPGQSTPRPLRLHQPAPPAHDTRRATRCIVLLRYPLGFQSMAWGCIIPALSVARAQIS